MAEDWTGRGRIGFAVALNLATSAGLTWSMLPAVAEMDRLILVDRTSAIVWTLGGTGAMLLGALVMAHALFSRGGMARGGALLALGGSAFATLGLFMLYGTIRHTGLLPDMSPVASAIPAGVCAGLALTVGRVQSAEPRPERNWLTWVRRGVAVVTTALVLVLASTAGVTGQFNHFESSALSRLRSLTTAQEQFKQQNVVDQDADGMGEYGFLGELSGAAATRSSGLTLSTSPFITSSLGYRDAQGIAETNGYHYVLYLPGKSAPVMEGEGTAAAPAIAALADGQEQRWACYAWPTQHRSAAARVMFFTNNAGEVYMTLMDKKRCVGTTSIPAPDAAYSVGTGMNLEGGVGLAAAELTSNDGNTWVPAGN